MVTKGEPAWEESGIFATGVAAVTGMRAVLARGFAFFLRDCNARNCEYDQRSEQAD